MLQYGGRDVNIYAKTSLRTHAQLTGEKEYALTLLNGLL
jgi:hypothetical protein